MRSLAHLFFAVIVALATLVGLNGFGAKVEAESRSSAARFRSSRGYIVTSRQGSLRSAPAAAMATPTPGPVNAECRIGQPIVISRSIAQQVTAQLTGKYSNIRVMVRYGRDFTKINVSEVTASGFKLVPGDSPLRYAVALSGTAPLAVSCVAQIPVFITVSARSSSGEQLRETTRSVVPVQGTYE